MNPKLDQFRQMVAEFVAAMRVSQIAQPAVMATFQPRFKEWAQSARGIAGLGNAVILADDIADQSLRHTSSIVVRAETYLRDEPPTPTLAAGSASVLQNGGKLSPVLLVVVVLVLVLALR